MFLIKSRRKRALALNEPIRHESHKKPVSRRDFLAQGFMTGAATVVAPSILGLLANPRLANALDTDMQAMATNVCRLAALQGSMIPFICFDLAGGANIAGSNVLVGKEGGQLDFLSTQGYSKQGLPGNMLPNNPAFLNQEFGLAFHSDSAFLRGIQEKTALTTRANINGAVIAARSENDTGNNPHNPMYGIARAGAKGELLTLIGSQTSDSGGNSMAPAMLMDPENRPTKIDRNSDVVGLVDTGELGTLFSDSRDTVAVMESMVRLTNAKMQNVDTGLSPPTDPTKLTVEEQFRCGYLKTAQTVENFSSPAALNPALDPDILGPNGVFGPGTTFTDREFEKTAAVMKLVLDGPPGKSYAGAGTISMGGYDYHTGDRATGETRDLRAGQCMGACLEYAARRGKPLMMYVFSDGSVSSNGRIDTSPMGRDKGEWTGDNQQTAASFFLVYNPGAPPVLLRPGNQIGRYSAEGDVVTSSSPAANNVNLLVQMVLLNYMALHGQQGQFNARFGNALGAASALDPWIAFAPIISG